MRASRLGPPPPQAPQAPSGKKRPKSSQLSLFDDKAAAAAVKPKMCRKNKRIVAPPAQFDGGPPTSMAPQTASSPGAVFALGMQAENRNAQDVLAYCAKLKEAQPWFVSTQNFVAGSDGVYEY